MFRLTAENGQNLQVLTWLWTLAVNSCPHLTFPSHLYLLTFPSHLYLLTFSSHIYLLTFSAHLNLLTFSSHLYLLTFSSHLYLLTFSSHLNLYLIPTSLPMTFSSHLYLLTFPHISTSLPYPHISTSLPYPHISNFVNVQLLITCARHHHKCFIVVSLWCYGLDFITIVCCAVACTFYDRVYILKIVVCKWF